MFINSFNFKMRKKLLQNHQNKSVKERNITTKDYLVHRSLGLIKIIKETPHDFKKITIYPFHACVKKRGGIREPTKE